MEEQCIKCGHCVAACPAGSFNHRDIPMENCPPFQRNLLKVTAEEYEHIFRSRRSIRYFQDKPIPRDLITRLIEIARYSPTGHNNQNIEWIVIDNPKGLKHLGDISLDWARSMVKDRPEFAEMMGFSRILKRWDDEHYNEIIRNTPALVIVHAPHLYEMGFADSISALTYFDLAARSVGLGCCLNGFIYLMASSFLPMEESLRIPEKRKAYGFMMVGYPKYTYQRLPPRNRPKITWR
jgi:nitroreductase